MAAQRVRPGDPDLVEACLDEVSKRWVREEFNQGRTSTRTMTARLRADGHKHLKRQDVMAWINREVQNGTTEVS